MKKKAEEKYLSDSWIDPRLEVKKSDIHGHGVFTSQDINAGEIIMIWGGEVIPKKDFDDNLYREFSLVPISEDHYLGLSADVKTGSLDEFLNHSCDPNAWLNDEVTVSARRHIKKGEEITVDFATWDDGGWAYSDDGRCSCGSNLCRGRLTNNDWQRTDLQDRYGDHFSPYLRQRIMNSNRESAI